VGASARFTIQSNESLDLTPPLAPKVRAVLPAMSAFEQALKRALCGEKPAEWMFTVSSHQLISIVSDLTWALLQRVGDDGTRVAHHFETDLFPVPPGWRTPMEISTLSRADLRLRQALLATSACLLFPAQFVGLASSSCYLGSPKVWSRMLQPLGQERMGEGYDPA
jgi:hypothetical protein